jgi:hypothetical protein
VSEPTPESDRSFYTDVPSTLSHAVAIGGALITMVEPHPGHEVAYNRWYEDDHFYAGAMCMPWMMAGRRYVATRDLQLLRYPDDSEIAQPVTAGCYIHLYWITVEHFEDHLAWTRSTNLQLTAQNRRYEERTHVFTEFQPYVGATYRDADGPRDIHSLDYPYGGFVLEVIHAADGVERADLDQWLREDYLPGVVGSPASGAAQSLRFWSPVVDVPAGARQNQGTGGRDETDETDEAPQVMVPQRGFAIPGAAGRITLIHFLEGDPRDVWDAWADHGARVAEGGKGRLELCAPFIPVLHGTNRYTDELR